MKSLKRSASGKFVVVTEELKEPRSPIVTETNFPHIDLKQETPKKSELKATLLSEETLLEEMKKAGGKDLTTSQFALLITPCIKKSVDEHAHHRWDQAHSHVRNLMRKLVDKERVSMKRDPSTKKLRYLYNLLS